MSADESANSEPAFEIRSLPTELIASFHQAVDTVARERRFLTFLEAPALEMTRRFVLDGQKKRDVRLAAVRAAEVIGWCDISRHAFAPKMHRGTLGIGVLPQFRGQGIGLALMRSALDEAWRSGFTRIELEVYADNAPAIALYEKIGFVREGIIEDAVRVDGRYRDAIAMSMVQRGEA